MAGKDAAAVVVAVVVEVGAVGAVARAGSVAMTTMMLLGRGVVHPVAVLLSSAVVQTDPAAAAAAARQVLAQRLTHLGVWWMSLAEMLHYASEVAVCNCSVQRCTWPGRCCWNLRQHASTRATLDTAALRGTPARTSTMPAVYARYAKALAVVSVAWLLALQLGPPSTALLLHPLLTSWTSRQRRTQPLCCCPCMPCPVPTPVRAALLLGWSATGAWLSAAAVRQAYKSCAWQCSPGQPLL